MKSLPLDVTTLILSYLPLRERILSRRVCRFFWRALRHEMSRGYLEKFLQTPTVWANVEVCPPGHIAAMGFDARGTLHVICRALESNPEEELLLSSRHYDPSTGGFEFVGLETLQGMASSRLSHIKGHVTTLVSPQGRPYCVDCNTLRHYPSLPVSVKHLSSTPDGTVFVGLTEEGNLHALHTKNEIRMVDRVWSLTFPEPRFPMVDRVSVAYLGKQGAYLCLIRYMQYANRYGLVATTWDADFSDTSFRQHMSWAHFAAHSEFAVDAKSERARCVVGEVVKGTATVHVASYDLRPISSFLLSTAAFDEVRYFKQIEVIAEGNAIAAFLLCGRETHFLIISLDDGALMNVVRAGKACMFAMHPTYPVAAISVWSETSSEASHPLVAYFECGMVSLVRFDVPKKGSSHAHMIPHDFMGVVSSGLYAILVLSLVHLLLVHGWWPQVQSSLF